MDWPLDSAGLVDSDFSRVYRYAPQDSTVVRLLTTDPGLAVWSQSSPEDWSSWLRQSVPVVGRDSGLVLILARRGDEPSGFVPQLLSGGPDVGPTKTSRSFKESYNEKDRSYTWPLGEKATTRPPPPKFPNKDNKEVRGGTQSLRRLPFDEDSFRDICDKFHVHSSISRAISRADVPLFSRAEVNMVVYDSKGQTQPAITYNCRSANSWKDDLALTVTYFPESLLTFGILFGCTAATEKEVLNRLSGAKISVTHPLLLPGIFAELERIRILGVVERTVNDIEAAIYELNSGEAAKETTAELATEVINSKGGPRSVRRNVWLNTTFLRSRLQTWRTQLTKMLDHTDELAGYDWFYERPQRLEDENSGAASVGLMKQFGQTNVMIKRRLNGLIEDMDEQMGECTMRIDGMTIATQWAQGDTSADIAAAAGRDSSQMRSISLVTMVFLPGTFFATLFSMTFFNWFPQPDSGTDRPIVSNYLWIYFVLTGAFTVFTLGMWWYFLVFRPKKVRQRIAHQMEEDIGA